MDAKMKIFQNSHLFDITRLSILSLDIIIRKEVMKMGRK